jgi:hypothetical protein
MITERTNTMSPRGGTREGAGRPTGSGSGTKRKAVSISLTEEEKAELDRISAELGISNSDFVRLALMHSAVLAVLYKEGK